MSHQSVIEFMKTFIESLGFKDVEWTDTEYKEGKCSYCYLPAPYGVGNIQVSILEGHVSFHYCALYVHEIEEKWQELYKTDKVTCKQDGFSLEVPNISHWDEWTTNYGYYAGCVLNADTLPKVMEFAKKLITGYTKKNVYSLFGTNAINKQEWFDWIVYTAMTWSQDEFLWESIIKIQYGQWTDRITLENMIENWKKKHSQDI